MSKGFKIGLVNFMTLIRLIGTILLIPVFVRYGGVKTFYLVALCFITDSLDGTMARGFKCATLFGSLFDGISDKAFLIVNMIILIKITPLALAPIILEIAIASVQSIKYYNNMRLKVSIVGKIKMFVAGIIISLCYLLVDSKYASLKIFSYVLSPLIICEIMTLFSYVKEYFKAKKENTLEDKEKRQKEEEKLIKKIRKFKITEIIFYPKFYLEYKDYANFHLAKKILKKENKY